MAEFFTDLINYLIAGVGLLLEAIMMLFPDSPFRDPNPPPPNVNLNYIAWLIPYNTMLAHILLLATAVLTYYIIRVAARWIKLVRS